MEEVTTRLDRLAIIASLNKSAEAAEATPQPLPLQLHYDQAPFIYPGSSSQFQAKGDE
jgi:hypothetical protein